MNNLSPMHFDIHCPHFSACSGCAINEAVNHPPVLLDAKAWFKDKAGVDFVLHTGKVVGWRMRAKLAVRGSAQNPQVGLYKEGSHDVVDIPLCKVHHPAINRGVELVKALIKQHNLSLYDEKRQVGDLRYLQFIVERSSGRLHITFVLNFEAENHSLWHAWREILRELWKTDGGLLWHSFSVNFNTRRDNVIFSPSWVLVFGEPLIWESFLGVDVCFQASSFAQANIDQFENLLKTIARWLPAGSTVAEYYAGVGVIGLTLAAKSKQVLACEINPHAQSCFEESRQRLAPQVAQKISWFGGPAANFAAWLGDADVIVVDPPRKGLEAKLIANLAAVTHAAKLVYVSCGWHSFKRDAAALLLAGWHLSDAEGHLFFPGSDHIEVVALFQKTNA